MLIMARSDVFIVANVIGFTKVILMQLRTSLGTLRMDVFVLRLESRTRSIVAMVDVEIVLTSQMLDNVVTAIER